MPLDVADTASITQARDTVAETTDTLDLLVNNAGTYAAGEAGLFCVNAAKMARVFAVNVIAPVILTQVFAPLLQRGTKPLVASLTSGVGLLTDTEGEPGSQYSYAATKSALNR